MRIKGMVLDSKVFNDFSMGATKAHDVCVNVIGSYEKLRLVKLLQTHFFFVCIDESTDSSKDKSLAIEVRYADPIDGKVKTCLWEMATLLQMGKKANAGSERILEVVRESFEKLSVPLNNILGFCFDGCNTMNG